MCSFWKPHDWYIIDEDHYYYDDGTYSTYQNKVCLICKAFVEELPNLKKRIEGDRLRKLSRKELAKELWDDRYNPNEI
jgi:hypothetical protein